MVFGDQGGEERAPMMLRGSVVEEVGEFKYLGSILTSDGCDARDMTARIGKAWGCFRSLRKKVWKRKSLSLQTKMRVYSGAVIPTLLWGCESWVLTFEDMEQLEVTQMRMLRSIMHISLKEHLTNVEIRQRAGSRQ